MRYLAFLVLILFVVAVVYELLFPTKVEVRAPDLNPIPEVNYWRQFQAESLSPINRYYFLDDPTEAWHEADEHDDSDDPELYNNKYDGK